MSKKSSQNSSPTPSKDNGEFASLLGDEDHFMADPTSSVHDDFGNVSQHHFNLPQMLSTSSSYVLGAVNEIITVKRGLVDKANIESPIVLSLLVH